MTSAAYSLETILDQAALEAQLERGVSPAYLSANGADPDRLELAGKSVRVRKSRQPDWSDDEHAFLAEHLGRLTFREIGRKLGRSANAVKIRRTRTGLPAPSKQPGYLTANEAAHALGMDTHVPTMWEERGVLRFEPAGTIGGKTRRISYLSLCRFVYNPENWPYFRFDINKNFRQIPDPFLAALVERREAKWDDEWWTTGQARDYWGLSSSGVINKRIRTGVLPGVRWGNWFVKRSDVIRLDIRPVGKYPRQI